MQRQRLFQGNSLVKTQRLFPDKLLPLAGISSAPASIKRIGNIPTADKWHLLPLQNICQSRRPVLQNNPEVPIWSKHILGQKTALPPSNVPHTIHNMPTQAEEVRRGAGDSGPPAAPLIQLSLHCWIYKVSAHMSPSWKTRQHSMLCCPSGAAQTAIAP